MRTAAWRVGLAVAVLGILTEAAGWAEAGLLVDHSPGTTGANLSGTWSNSSNSQNFVDTAVFGSAVHVTGMDIYTNAGFAQLGATAVVRVRSDNGGTPGALISQTTETISAVDTVGSQPGDDVRVHVDLAAPLNLAAGTYWFGMSGDNYELGQWGLTGPNAPDDSRMYQYGGLIPEFFTQTNVGDQAFRLEGDPVNAVPEPATLAPAVLAALAGAGYAWRKRRRAAA
jgi:hypothetical protein